MKKFIMLLFFIALSGITYAQVDFEGGTHVNNRTARDFQDQRQSLIDSFQRSKIDSTLLNYEDLQRAANNEQLINYQDNRQIDSGRLYPNYNSPSYKINVPDVSNNQEQTAPLRLYFDQIQLKSSEVSEVTLKDGTVVTTQELQEFAKEIIKKKLNEQK
jgi:hypothetical protein